MYCPCKKKCNTKYQYDKHGRIEDALLIKLCKLRKSDIN